MSDTKKLRGRPPTGDSAKRHVVAIRATQELREKVDRAASAAGRSMSQEIEFRLERSFAEDAQLGDPRQAEFLKTAQQMMDGVSAKLGEHWTADVEAWSMVRSGLIYLLSLYRPKGEHSKAFEAPEQFASLIKDYVEASDAFKQRQFDAGRRFTELHIRSELSPLTEAEIDERDRLLGSFGQPIGEPKLPPDLLEQWRMSTTRAAKIKEAEGLLVAYSHAAYLRAERD